ncbi:mechanosensitive ion channel family protein [Sphingomonas cavernae]|nr:mechanosensitive ion channel domain-containing protein [Sphingomonas cavernae]
MTSTANGAEPILADVESSRTLVQFWDDSIAWISNHSVEVLIASGIAVGIVFGLLFIRRVGVRLCRKEDHTGWRTIVGRAVSKTSTFFMVMVAARLVAGYAEAPPLVFRTIAFLFTISAVLQFAVWAREIVLGMIERRAGSDDYHGEAIGNAMGIIRLLVSFAVFAIAGVVVLDNLGVNITGLVAGLGIGGIAIGMAAKGVFEDLFAALSILFDKPFRRGDAIKWDSTGGGTVESIGLKTTRIRAVSGEEIVVSNANLLNKELHNMTRLHRRRYTLTFGVVYSTPADDCSRIPDIAREEIEGLKKCHFLRCGMTGFGVNGLEFEAQFDVLSGDFETAFATRNAACMALLSRFDKEKIVFANPATIAPPPKPTEELWAAAKQG